ncbi:MAG: MOSC domain-containing protein [Pseudomonadota bacterium]
MADNTIRIVGLQVGKVEPLGPDGVPSGIVKRPTADRVRVGTTGIEGDGVADLRVHGGPEKAVYAYPGEHYPRWAEEFPEHAGKWVAGGVGENLTTKGFDETDVRIGDVFRSATGLALQVAQPRQPCFKFALKFEDESLPQAMLMNGRCGWYFRVLSEGTVAAGDALALEERGPENWTVARFQRLTTIAKKELTPELLREIAKTPSVALNWRRWAEERLAR